MAKHVLVGDIHGKHELVEKALDKEGIKVFVGDFLDSFDRKPVEQIRALTIAIEAKKQSPEEVILIYGNHELSYIMPDIHRCSGYNTITHTHLMPLIPDINKHFVNFYMPCEDILVTHAGLTKSYEKNIKDNWREHLSQEHIQSSIGMSRGGRNPYGGIFWCDFRYEFQPIRRLHQFFGHTAGKGIRQKGDSKKGTGTCIDCLDNEITFVEADL